MNSIGLRLWRLVVRCKSPGWGDRSPLGEGEAEHPKYESQQEQFHQDRCKSPPVFEKANYDSKEDNHQEDEDQTDKGGLMNGPAEDQPKNVCGCQPDTGHGAEGKRLVVRSV
jgi:hypothetical protein